MNDAGGENQYALIKNILLHVSAGWNTEGKTNKQKNTLQISENKKVSFELYMLKVEK